jgi:hypothetical protein
MPSTPTPRHLPTRLAALTTLLGLFILPAAAFGQGCLIARGGGGAMITDGSGYLEKGDWQVNLAVRHFDSHRHFAGDDEQTHRSDAGTEVYNYSWYYDTTLTYAWSKRLNLSATLPYVNHDRSSLYEHLGNNSGQRFATQASGMADVSLSASYWVIDPDHAKRWNLSVGLGLKLPTGNDEAKDLFNRSTGITERYVDSSIQPGDAAFADYTWNFSLSMKL